MDEISDILAGVIEGVIVRVISKSRLKQFWETPEGCDSQGPLRAWYTHVNHKMIAWRNWGDVRFTFRNADLVGNCVVFNIGGNKFRLITRVLYSSQKVFILKVLTHQEYDRNNWKVECGCFTAPPRKLSLRYPQIRKKGTTE